MGPATAQRKTTTTSAGAGSSSRMDAARRLLRTPPSPSTSSEQSQQHAPQLEWSSPSFTRARARPSNLHSYLRASPSFPLNPPPHQQQPRGTSTSTSDAPPSSSSAGRAASSTGNGYAAWTKRSELRSQRSQATQTAAEAQQQQHARARTRSSSSSSARSVHLGTFGDVSAMSLDTVDYLIRVLEDRKQELLVPPEGDARVRAGELAQAAGRSTGAKRERRGTTTRTRTRKADNNNNNSSSSSGGGGACDDEFTESSDASDDVLRTRSSPAAAAPVAPTAAPIVRSRSYEALVQLEGILEARHQQLMSNGLLEPSSGQYHDLL